MSQCQECMCKTCYKHLFCRGLINICQGCYTDNYIPWPKCALQLQMFTFLSPSMATVSVNGRQTSIKNHLSNVTIVTDKARKYFKVDSNLYPMEYFQQYQRLLWVKYFKENPNIVKFVKHIKAHEDLIVGEYEHQISVAIRYMDIGERNMLIECKELIHLMSRASKKNVG